MSRIKDFNVTYGTIDESDTFSEGDTIVGTVSFSLTKAIKVKSVSVKAKGDANVHWSEGSGDDERSYSDHRRYFKVKELLVAENAKGTSLPQGVHYFKFRLKIPEGNMPSSFTGCHGKVVYMVEAKISRSWRWPSTVQKEIKFVSKAFLHTVQVMANTAMCPQSSTVSKKMSGLSKGQVQMSATINRTVCFPGETLSVATKICNSSSKDMKLKFKLQERIVYRAGCSSTSSEKTLFKKVGDNINPNSEESVSCQVKIPVDVIILHNCEIISVEYYIKVYVDISFATDPEVVFPLVIVPPSFAAFQPGEALGPYPSGTAGAPSYSDFTSFNQWPQGAPPYEFSAPAFSSPPVQYPGSTALPQFQQEEPPPSYTSLYPHQNEQP
ncbi:arrestin domain-containing protein 3-like isoform X1 [Simochromis diagramma]|uniref:arrestin domain-containing protein 3-like isoform X1 n=1 Tax=Simochromis diagramma TaxID=43689 RepID=UPI001A7E3DE0|nr:arrestin domain-containing protein 3-like isoform X1 [Simochromis diagramma]XP_039875433.1 arrestin domain-containing protein 3-like isoform X1 [Simochromis diagramma]